MRAGSRRARIEREHGRERPRGGHGDHHVTMVDEPRPRVPAAVAMRQILDVGEISPALSGKLAVLVLPRFANRRLQVAGPDRELPPGGEQPGSV